MIELFGVYGRFLGVSNHLLGTDFLHSFYFFPKTSGKLIFKRQKTQIFFFNFSCHDENFDRFFAIGFWEIDAFFNNFSAILFASVER